MGPCWCGSRKADAHSRVEVPAGEVWRFTIPPGVVHAYRNTGDAVMVLVSFSTRCTIPTGGDTRREQIL